MPLGATTLLDYLILMSSRSKNVRPSDLPNKVVWRRDGISVRMKVVQSESPTLAEDLLAAFRSNVRRITSEQRKTDRASADSPKT